MVTLLLVLAPIALLDSTSLLPFAAVPLATMLGGKRAIRVTLSFFSGIFLVYMCAGLLIVLGLGALFDPLNEWFQRFKSDPNTVEIIAQIVIGVVMVALGRRLAAKRSKQPERGSAPSFTAGAAFAFGAGLMLIGLPGALPYFGAIDQILRADLPLGPSWFALLFYNGMFLLPLGILLLIRVLLPGRSEAIFGRVAEFTERWGRRFAIVVLLVLGAFFAVDGVSWLFGRPLIPIG